MPKYKVGDKVITPRGVGKVKKVNFKYYINERGKKGVYFVYLIKYIFKTQWLNENKVFCKKERGR